MWLNKYVDPSALFTGSSQSFDFVKILLSGSSCVPQMPGTGSPILSQKYLLCLQQSVWAINFVLCEAVVMSEKNGA